MAKNDVPMWFSVLVLVVGVLMLLRDWNVFTFWNIGGFSALFTLAGLYWVSGANK